jgi:hypothetical protein
LVVVYVVPEGDEALLRLHLESLARHTASDYRIYGSVHRTSAASRRVLDTHPEVSQIALPDEGVRGSREVSRYLSRLLDLAVAEGVENLVIMDVDAFPIRAGWDLEVRERLAEGNALVAMLRDENAGDPRPATPFIWLPATLYRQCGPMPGHPGEPSADPEFEAYRRALGRIDVSDAFGYWIERHQLAWHPLRRTNAANDHPLLGGIYGDLIFHLGGAVRRGAWTQRDRAELATARLRSWLRDRVVTPQRRPMRLPLWLKRLLLPTEARRLAANRKAFELIRARLLADPEAYIAYLRGERPDPPVVELPPVGPVGG